MYYKLKCKRINFQKITRFWVWPSDLGLGNDFLNIKPKAYSMKTTDKVDILKLKPSAL